MPRHYVMVSVSELKEAFKAFEKKNGFVLDFYSDLRKKLFQPFGAYKNRKKEKKVSSNVLYKTALELGMHHDKTRLTEDTLKKAFLNHQKYHAALSIIERVPSVRALNERLAKEETRKRDKAQRDFERRRNKHSNPVESRLDRLERENAELRSQVNNRPRTAEEKLAEREYWEKNDTRIGGHRDGEKWNPYE